MFRTVMRKSVIKAVTTWSVLPRSVFRVQPNIWFSIGRSASGKVAQTEATVRIPAMR
jgi:hypothetical protein